MNLFFNDPQSLRKHLDASSDTEAVSVRAVEEDTLQKLNKLTEQTRKMHAIRPANATKQGVEVLENTLTSVEDIIHPVVPVSQHEEGYTTSVSPN